MTIHTGGVRTDVELPPHIIGPAPKEEEMEPDKYCHEHRQYYTPAEPCVQCRAERRAVARDAYMAALGGLATHEGQCDGLKWGSEDTVFMAESLALETIKQWDAFMAAVDAEGGE